VYAGNTTYISRGLAASARVAKQLAGYSCIAAIAVLLAVGIAMASSSAIEAVAILLFVAVLFNFGEAGLRLAFHFFLIFNFGAFALMIGRLEMNGIIAPILTASGAFSLINIIAVPRVAFLMNRSWTVLAMCGLAVVSATWSDNPTLTFKDSLQLIFTTLLPIALVGRLGCNGALQLVIRTMSFICISSVLFAVVIPDLGVHQAYDLEQSVHAGLWRGVFTHKIALGTFAGLTFGLLAFYGWRAFYNPFSYAASLISAMLCIFKAGSATGVAMTIFFVGLLFATYRIAVQGLQIRRYLLRLTGIAVLLVVGLIFSGAFDRFVGLLGRSSDLTGRAEYWPHIIEFMHKSDALFGYGYGRYTIVGTAIKLDAGMYLGEAHNGFLEMVVAFGYPGAFFISAIHFYLLWRSGRSIVGIPTRAVMIGVLPFSLIATLLVASYVESIILEKRCVWTILLTLSVCIMVKLKAAQQKTVRRGRIVHRPVRIVPADGRPGLGLGQGIYLPPGAAEPQRL